MFFFLKLLGHVRVAIGLAVFLLIVAALGSSPRTGIVPGDMGWWDWVYFFIGVMLFLSLGAMLLASFCEDDLRLCGEPGVVPAWAQFFGFLPPAAPAPSVPPLPVSPPIFHTPKVRLIPYACRACGAVSDVSYYGAPCSFCGEAPPSSENKRSLFGSPKPKSKLIPYLCRSCGMTTQVPFIGTPCSSCGELPPTTAKKRSLFKDGDSRDHNKP